MTQTAQRFTRAVLLLLALHPATAATRYVDVNSASPTPPFTNWATAAKIIQDAVDAADAGDEVLVTKGVYATGGRAVVGTMTNRVAVTKPLTLRSLNGPEVTVIEGYQVPGTTNGDGAIRCVYLTNGAVLSGFTLTRGATRTYSDGFGGEDSGGGVWCQSANAALTNCILTANSASRDGGGASMGTLNDCTLAGNSALNSGGGAYWATLNGCVLTGNRASAAAVTTGGGGAYECSLKNCTLADNWAVYGGGAYRGTLNNCVLTGNSAWKYGGGAYGGTLNNCTLTGNSAQYCGGAYYGTLNNCVLYYNTALGGPNFSGSGTLNYCCATPLPTNGVGNIETEPQLANASHLSADSPCRSAGSAAYTNGLDIDGEPWLSPPSIGCDEFRAGGLTGALTAAIGTSWTNVATGVAVNLTGRIDGRAAASVWDFGDGMFLTNRPYASHAWAAPGDYPLVLTAYNDSHPEGVSATVTIRVVTPPVHYVSAMSANPAPPYNSWATATRTIQEAVDVTTVPGALVLVTNGVYATGGRAVYGTMTNRVAVTKPLMLRSVNGSEVTVIEGYQMPGTTNGDGAVRCVYLTNGAVLSGFTLTRGATRAYGDYYQEQSGGGVWCQSAGALVTNCTLTANSAHDTGGGTCGGTLVNCTITGNSADSSGGGASGGMLSNCTLTDNSAQYGGGAYGGRLGNCTLTDNSASRSGGGADGAILNGCALTGNSALCYGGGAIGGTLNNCTLTGNSATGGGVNPVARILGVGGGAYSATLNNCILCYNTAISGSNYSASTLNHCCATPPPSGGTGNIAMEPQLASDFRLSAGSPCRGAGSANYAAGADLDGEAWLNPPSIGCDEYTTGNVTGDLTVAIGASWTNVAVGFAVDLTGWISGRVSANVWDFGDGTVLSNRPYTSHAWSEAGDYAVVLRAYNESHAAGVSATMVVRVVPRAVHYVSAASTNPVPPYGSWGTAARILQEAVDVALPGGEIVVTNGVYAAGGRAVSGAMTSRVAVDRPVVVRSVNGPELTVIEGYQVPGTEAVRCVYLVDGAVLSGFTLTRGATRGGGDDRGWENGGGGVWCGSPSALVTNCILTGNSALYGGGAYGGTLNHCVLTGNSAYEGGGVYMGTLVNCVLTGNMAVFFGGGASGGLLSNCTVALNAATDPRRGGPGGASYSTLNNCVLYYNGASADPAFGNYAGGTFTRCCTTPMPYDGLGNITNAPLFVDLTAGNLRLQTNSPCINAGDSAYASDTTDLDGNPRIVGGTVDIGAYEFQTPTSLLSYAWAQQYGLPTDGSADFTDNDADLLNNWQEWRAGTIPTNAFSVLRLLTPVSDGTNLTVTWESVAGRNYFLECSPSLSSTSAFTRFATNLPGQTNTTSFVDTNAVGASPRFYRVGVE